jgi:hypothetical protein
MSRLEKFYFPFFMAAFMTIIMSFALTVIYQGFSSDFLFSWGRAFILAFPVAFPSVVLLAPPVYKMSEALKRKAPITKPPKNL